MILEEKRIGVENHRDNFRRFEKLNRWKSECDKRGNAYKFERQAENEK